MATKRISKIYLDACCFVEVAAFDSGKHKPERERDVLFIKALLAAAFDGEIEAYTSTLSIPECQCVKDDKQRRILTPAIKDAFRLLLTSGQFVVLVQDGVLIGEQARDLSWVHQLVFGGADSVHIASAVSAGCEEFITFDEKTILVKAKELDELFGLRAIKPRLSSVVPTSKHPDAGPLFVPEEPPTETQTAPEPEPAKLLGSGDGDVEGKAETEGQRGQDETKPAPADPVVAEVQTNDGPEDKAISGEQPQAGGNIVAAPPTPALPSPPSYQAQGVHGDTGAEASNIPPTSSNSEGLTLPTEQETNSKEAGKEQSTHTANSAKPRLEKADTPTDGSLTK